MNLLSPPSVKVKGMGFQLLPSPSAVERGAQFSFPAWEENYNLGKDLLQFSCLLLQSSEWGHAEAHCEDFLRLRKNENGLSEPCRQQESYKFAVVLPSSPRACLRGLVLEVFLPPAPLAV